MAKRRPSGDCMVRKREDGRWEGRIVVGHKSNGDSIFRYLSAGSQKELLAKLHRNIEEYRDVDLREESKMPLGEWLDRWLEEYAAPSVRPSQRPSSLFLTMQSPDGLLFAMICTSLSATHNIVTPPQYPAHFPTVIKILSFAPQGPFSLLSDAIPGGITSRP